MRGPRVVFRSSILPSEWSCLGEVARAKFGFFGCRTIRLVCRRGTAGTAAWTPRPPLAAVCYAKIAPVQSTQVFRTIESLKGLRSTRGGRRSSLQTTRGGNPRRRQWAPRPNFRPRASARVISTRDRMAELTAKKPRRTRQPTEKRLPVSSPARATEITPPGGSPSHSLARPHRVAARRESARGQRAAPETRPRRRWPLEAHAAPPAHPAGTPMSPTCAAAWKTPLAQPGRGAFA